MPISVRDLKIKDRTPAVSARNNADLLALRDIMLELNKHELSYLKEDLKEYADAISVILAPNQNTNSDESVGEAIEKLAGFNQFLTAGVGKTNFKRLLDDCSLTANHKEDGPETVKRGMNVLIDYLSLDYKVQDLENAVPVPGDFKETRPPHIANISNYEQLMEEKVRGKNFLDPKSREHRQMKGFLDELKTFANTLQGRIESGEVQNVEEATAVLNGIRMYGQAMETLCLRSGDETHNEQEEQAKKDSINAAINTLKGFKDYLYAGDPNNYRKWQDAGFSGAYLFRAIKILDKNLDLGIDAQQLSNIEVQKALQNAAPKRGDRVIDALKLNIRQNFQTIKQNPDYPAKQLAEEFAVRVLTDSTPGNLDTLKRDITAGDLKKKTEAIFKNKHFQDFVEDLKKDPKKLEKVDNDFKSYYSHGGTIEKMFTEYLLHLPAGELQNTPELSRFMPKVIDRIEELQKQAKVKTKADKEWTYIPAAEMAEVILLRHSIGVGHNQKDALKVKIPCDNSLKNTNKLARDQRFYNTFAANENNIKKFHQGHGGNMTADYNEAAQNKAPKVNNPVIN